MGNNIIEIKDLTFGYSKKLIFNQLSLFFTEGSIVSMIGPNGSGKTTLLKAIAGILSPNIEENILIRNKKISEYSKTELAQQIAFVPQRQDIIFDFSVYDIVMMGRNPYQKRWAPNSNADEEIVNSILQKTHLWELKDRMMGQLSGGEMQRTMIARAMAQQSPILLLDEPLANLDIAHKFEIMDILQELNQVNQTTIIIILHDFSFAKQYTDQTLLLNKGTVQLYSDSNEVITTKNIQKAFSLSDDYQVDNHGNIIRNN